MQGDCSGNPFTLDIDWLNKLIMNQALRGYTDCTGPITVNWNTFENYVSNTMVRKLNLVQLNS